MSSHAGLKQMIQFGEVFCDTFKSAMLHILEYIAVLFYSVGFPVVFSSDTIVHHLSIVNPSGFLRILTSKNFSREIILAVVVRMAFKLSQFRDTPLFCQGL